MSASTGSKTLSTTVVRSCTNMTSATAGSTMSRSRGSPR
jgi:hypothetical protein